MQMVIIIIILLSLYIKHTFIYVSGGWLSLAKTLSRKKPPGSIQRYDKYITYQLTVELFACLGMCIVSLQPSVFVEIYPGIIVGKTMRVIC